MVSRPVRRSRPSSCGSRVLLGEALAQVAGARVDHRRRAEVDAEFSGPANAPGPPPRMVRSAIPRRSSRPARKQDAVVVTLGSTIRFRSGVGALHQLVGEHLRVVTVGIGMARRSSMSVMSTRCRIRCSAVSILVCDVAVTRPRVSATATGRRERVQVGGDDRQPQADTGDQPGDLPVQ